MLSVPRALTSKSVFGSTSDVVTATCAARWRTASWPLTCWAIASPFLTSSLTNVVRFGYRVRIHLRLRSVPGLLRLSSSVTSQPCLIRWVAAFTPRKPAPPVMRARRSGLFSGGSERSSVSRAMGYMGGITLAGGNASEIGDRHDPRRAGQDEGLAPVGAAPRVEEGAGKEQDGECAVDVVQQPRTRAPASDERGEAKEALQDRDPGHQQVAGAKAAAELGVGEVIEGAPQSEYKSKDQKDACPVSVRERAQHGQSDVGPADLAAEVVDRQAQALLEIDPRLPPELLLRPRVVEGDPVHVAPARRSVERRLLVLGQERELAEEVVHGDRDPRAHVVGPSITALQRGEVCS